MGRIETTGRYEAMQFLTRALSQENIHFQTYDDSRSVRCWVDEASFALSFLPGNCRTLVSHAVETSKEHRGKGVGRRMLQLREKCARAAGVTLLMATVKNNNAPEMHLLLTEGWKRLTVREDTGCSLWVKELTYSAF